MSDSLEARPKREVMRGFVDVLGSRSTWPPANEREPDAYLAGRRRLPLSFGPVTIDSVDLPAGQGTGLSLSGDEFVLALSGAIRFSQGGRELRLEAGDAGVVLRDQALDWSADQPTELVIMRCTAGGGAGASEPVRIDVEAPLAPSGSPLAELLISAVPVCRNHSDYRSASGEFVCGTWDSTPYHRRLMTFRHFELMRLLEGEVTFMDEQGEEGTFGAGDVVLFVQGGGCSWESQVHVKKIYSTYRPAQ